MEYGHPVAPSDGHKQMEEPRTEADAHSVAGDEEEHHEKKPMMTRMRNRMRKMKDSMTKKMHGHVDDHDVHDDDEHSAEAEAEAEAEHIDLGINSRSEHVPLSSPDDRPVTLASRDQDVPLVGLGSQDERPVSLSNREERPSGLQEPPVAPETIKDTALDADPVDPLRNRSVSRTDDGNISDPKTGNEQSVSPDVLSSFRDMDISSDVEKEPSYTENLSATAAGVKEGEDKPSYTEKLPATAVAAKDAAVSATSDVYAKVAGGTESGETHDEIATPGSIGHGVEVEPREGAEEEKGSYTEKLPATVVAAKDAALSAASAVYAKVASGNRSSEAHDQIATPSTGYGVKVEPKDGVEVEPREGPQEEKGSYIEKLPATVVAAKDAALSAASAVYAKVASGNRSGETHDQIATVSTGHGVEVEPTEGGEEEKGSYTHKLPTTIVAAKDAALSAVSAVYTKVASGNRSAETHDQIATPGSAGPCVEVEPREGAEEKGSYTEKLPATVVAAKDAALSAASAVYAKVAGGAHSGETHDQIVTPGSIGHGVEVEPRESAGEEKGTVLAAKDAALSAASAVYDKVASISRSGETHDQIATPESTGPVVEVEPGEGAGEEKGSYTEKLPATPVAVKDAVVSAASTVYAKVAGGTHSGETHDQIATPGSTGTGVEVEPREGAGEKEGTYMEQFTGAAWAVYGKMMGAGTAGDGTEQEISESKKRDAEEHEVVEDKGGEVKGRIVLPEVTAGEIGVNQVVGKEGGGDGGKGMMGMFNRAVNSMVGGDGDGGSGGPAAAAEVAGGGAAKERAHE